MEGESDTRTMATRRWWRWRRRPCHAVAMAVCVLVMMAATAGESVAAEIDSDLVFDDGTNHNANSDASVAADHHRLSRHRRSNVTYVLLNKKTEAVVSPVSSPIEEPVVSPPTVEEADGILHHVHNFGKRLKRGLFSLLGRGDDDVAREKRSPEVDNELTDEAEIEKIVEEEKRRARPLVRSRGDSDDEDDIAEYSGGSGSSTKSPATPMYYRCTVHVHEPYVTAFNNRSSQQFKSIARQLVEGIDTIYRDTPGRQEATVINIQQTSDVFFSKVTFDLGSHGNDDYEVIKKLNQTILGHRIGNVEVRPEGFTVRVFGNCAEGEMMCDITRCIQNSQRCDGKPDCTDGTDEQGCPAVRPDCRTDEFRCQTGRCIPYTKRCDRHQDCDGGDDEDGCKVPCAAHQWQCDFGTCIDRKLRCDNKRDCPEDDSDERSCREQCAANEFQCVTDKICIPSALRCNRQNDCHDASDEDRCPASTSCRSDQFRCDDGLCLNINQRCNGVDECYNGEDERSCYSVPVATTPTTCGVDDFVCDDGSCISGRSRCDGTRHCSNNEDEANCVGCGRGKFRCSDGTCIDEALHCNGYPECRDRSDEADCPEGCKPREFMCSDRVCISDAFRCDGYEDCLDKSDEIGCPSRVVPCTERQFKCGDGKCIDQSIKCDGRVDCDDASDETECGCQPSEFTCASGDCVPESARCNRRADCRDGSDERNCPPLVTPPTHPTTPAVRCPGEFACRTGGQCLPLSVRCNGRMECQDFSDEDNCHSTAGGLNLKTYPNDQIIKESREVVFQCRDEGPLRARVQWIRAGNLPLPPGSYDNNGRLEMPNIQVEHSGDYICEAVGYSRNTPGASLSVHLEVEKFTVAPTRPPTACGLQEATCVNGECINKQLVCDGKFDCSDGSDEMRCNPLGCEPNEFRCSNKKCVLKTWRCDSENDCGDNSDELNCATVPPGSQCQFHEYQCRTGNQCIPKSFHCDLEIDCLDGSDEVGCSPVHITQPPPPMIELSIGDVFTITCTAIGVPVPEISWRLNWGHIPSKCVTTSVNGIGTLTCGNIQEPDQGAYSCEAINNRGSRIGVPDTILVIKKERNVCSAGTFNSEARTRDDCIPCFCFGVATDCDSADLFTYQLPPPFDQHKLINVRVQGGDVVIGNDFLFGGQTPYIRPVGAQGFQTNARTNEHVDRENVPFFAIPENFHGNQLKSYGGYLNFTVLYEGSGRPVQGPDVILTGNGYTLVHTHHSPLTASRGNDISVRFFYGDWHKRTTTGRPGGDIPSGHSDSLATRAEIMMALGSVDNILIKSQYVSGGTTLDTTITDIRMDSAGIRNTGQGQATFVEECRCPSGYSGLSCENCAAGYHRHRSGPWLGQCIREPAPCPNGQYRDPRSQQCAQCPCPLTNPDNQFGQSCHVDTDGQVTCDCPAGYVGRRCEQCIAGYNGNPLQPGDYCKRGGQCDARGSVSSDVNPSTGRCDCKSYTSGTNCDVCQANTFNLDAANQFGCINCFCTGIPGATCTSSNWYRQQVVSSFVRNTQDFKLVDKANREEPITDGIRLDSNTREIIYQDFSRRSPDVYYWLLPTQFLGDKITSYGGVLNYTLRYVPAPGGASSRNNAPDVELISSNDIKLMYFGRDQLEPDRHQTISVPLLEQYWQRQDGQAANREHLLMALADTEAILIKATYTTNTREVALSHVSLDIAEERNTGQSRATAVEQCSCPRGYKGLSCHDCDVGFTRGDEGLYLGLCEPCNCNQHSDECHPDTGLCVNCRDFTEGDQCDRCIRGYVGNPSEGGACVREDIGFPIHSCDCNVDGSRSKECREGQCQCKTNVEGRQCDTCRKGCYDLSSANSEGCLQCFCSGVTDSCQSSNFYRTQIPMDLIDSRHGFTLTDSSRRDVISDGLELDRAENEIGYSFSDSRNQRLFWSLPPKFTGNQITSYGGNLTVTQRVTASRGSPTPDQDVIIVGNGVTIYWTNPQPIQSNRKTTFAVPLRESSWTHLDSSGPRPASRADLLTALASVEAMLIRATHVTPSQATYLSDVSLDTAVAQFTRDGRATEVEACRCPAEYRGTSCESCAAGHYRDVNDRSTSVFGSCKRCPCNGNEESCSTSPDGRGVTCQCRPQFVGRYCDTYPQEPEVPPTHPPVGPPTRPTISITISEPTIQIVEVGSSVRYRCFGQSLVTSKPVMLVWSKEGGVLPRDRAIDDLQGLLVITDVRVSDSGSYLCTARDGSSIVTERAVLTVGGSTAPHVTITPRYITAEEGEPATFRCEGTGNPAPHIRWTFETGQLNTESTFRDGVFRIGSVRKSDEGTYECSGESSAGSHRSQAQLYVRERAEQPAYAPKISPQEYTGPGGSDTIRFVCTSSERAVIRWSRVGGRELPSGAVQRDGSLIIYNSSPADSGVYVCTATSSTTGHTETVEARVTIVNTIGPPTVRIEPDRQTVSQGTLAELRCLASSDPAPSVRWTKVGEDMPRHVQVNGASLLINNVQVSDRGVYVCQAENSGGTGQASAIIEVERREPPSIELHPESHLVVTSGGSALLQCRVTGGIPSPQVRWSRPNGRPLTLNVEELPSGVLRFQRVSATEAGQYTCHADNDAGQVTAVATLEIQSPPVLHLLPGRSVVKSVGDRVRLDCRADGEPTPTVSWSKYQTGRVSYSDARQPINPETPQSAVYEVSRLRKEDEGAYICKARNSAGETEERLQLIVEETSVPIPAPTSGEDSGPYTYPPRPTVTSEQDVWRVPVGGKAEMRCRVRGNRDRIFLDWIRPDHLPMPAGYVITDGVLFIENVEASAAGEYSCLGLSSSGQTLFTANARLEVIAPPRIALNPTRQVVKPGDHAYITCSATGDQPITIEWSALGRAFSPRATANQGYLQFRGIEVSDAGRYVCKAVNSAGEAEAAAEVIVSEHQTQPTVTAVQRDQSTQVGSSIQLRCVVPSEERGARIHWRRERSELPRSATVRGHTLELTNVQAADQGRYVCELRTHEGTSSDYIDLRVEPVQAPTLAIRLTPSQEVVRIGDTIDVRCLATGQSSSNAHIGWTKHGEQLETNAQAYGNLLRISDVRPSNGGLYRCTVRTLTGQFTEDYVLAIQDNNVLNTDSAPVETRTAPHGSTVMMDCRTDLESPVTYSWSKQGGHLPKDSNIDRESLTIHDVRGADAGTYVCTAQNGAVKMDIPTVLVVTGVVPHFAQAPNSYLALPTLPDAYLVFAIEVAFKPDSGDGLILYNGQLRGGGGDFISLGLNRSYVEFRFNVGSGPALIRSPHPITIGEWHTVKLHRTRKEGAMYVDGEGPVQGMALGRFQGLDLVEPLYVGGVPDFNDVHKLNGFVKGFVGCISRLVIGSVEHDLVRDATFKHGVTSCETCAINPCKNRGVCQEANAARGYSCICPASFSGQDCERVGLACYPGACGSGRCVNRQTEGFDCYCPFGRSGPKCQDEIGITEPAFADDAYLAYPTPKAVKRLKMALRVNPKTTDDGILLYCSQSEDGHGDFASLAIRDKRLEFRFDTGSGPAVLRSVRDVVPGQWLTVSAGRDLREGHLSVNNDSPITGRSPGDKRGLNLRTSLYVGGYDKQKVKLASGVGVARGFQGCISEVKVAGVEMDMFTALVDSANVQDCSAISNHLGAAACDHNPCHNGGQCTGGTEGHYTCQCPFGFSGRNCESEWDICQSQRPCQNGGSCVPTTNSYKCRCPLGYSGENCHNVAELSRDVSFGGDGFVELRNSLLPHKDSAENEIITVEFTTSEADGLIFWHGQEPSTDGRGQDFLALAVVDGYLEFSYELGSGPALIRAAGLRVDDTRRHKAVLKRQGTDGSIELDNGITEFGESGGLLNTLNTRGNIYIGGVEDFDQMTAGRYSHGFNGCIHKIHFQQSEVNIGDNAVAGVNASPCSNGEDDDDNDIASMEDIVH